MTRSPPIVLLHGWGFDSRIWQDIIPELQKFSDVIAIDLPCFGESTLCSSDISEVSVYLLQQLPPRSVLLGWSLGGMIATHIAIHYPQRVAGLITVGSNLKWVSDNTFENHKWPGAAPENFAAFFENLAQNFDNTINHFCGVIARGDEKEKSLVKKLRATLSSATKENFLTGLRLLDSIDNRAGYQQLKMPGLHIFGDKDAMVSLDVEQCMRRLNNRHRTVTFPDAAHAPFLGAPQFFLAIVRAFIDKLPYQRDRKQLSVSFSKAALTYDGAAQLQREIGHRLYSLLSSVATNKSQRRVVLDLGCGTGAYGEQLQRLFPSASIVSLDIAQGMLQVAGQKNARFAGVCADAEYLPLKENSIDIIFSNLAVQWCQDYVRLFSELKRVLKPEGIGALSTFQQGTLRELKAAWQFVDDRVHVNEFAYAENLKEMALQVGLSSIAIQHQTLVKHYDQVKQLTQELKAIGAHNINQGRPDGLTSKSRLGRVYKAYEQYRHNDKLPAHYEVLYLTFTKE